MDRGFSLKSLSLTLVIAFLVCFSTFDSCNARRGKHWRQNRAASSSLSKKKVKNNGGHGSKSHGGSKSPSPAPAPTPGHGSKSHGGSKSPSPAPTPAPPKKGHTGSDSTVFNVIDFGAKGDGATDDTKAFQAAWAAACKVEASTMMVPSKYKFFVGPISFSGPYCQQNIVFQLDGTIIAPTSTKAWGSGLYQWLEFSKLRGITIQGSGIIEGQGSVWWSHAESEDPAKGWKDWDLGDPARVELSSNMPSIKPTAMRFYGSTDVTVKGITLQNSPQCHLKFDNCQAVEVFNITVSSPGDSLNTDGIHLQNSRDVSIHNSNLACGDDCVSIQTGCTNVYIHNVNCGPGHGISIGGLGKDNTKACVSNVTVRDVMMHNTMNGVRIKTWQGGSGSVQGIQFSNIQVSEVQVPIIIDQFYCDKSTCKNQSSAVALSGISYERIKGTYTVKPVHLACSDNLPCTDVTLTNIDLTPMQERYHLYEPFCWQTFGELRTPTVPPINCLQMGKPLSNRIQSSLDSC